MEIEKEIRKRVVEHSEALKRRRVITFSTSTTTAAVAVAAEHMLDDFHVLKYFLICVDVAFLWLEFVNVLE